MTRQNKNFGLAIDPHEYTQAGLVVQPESNFDTAAVIGVNAHFPAYVNTISETARGLKMSEKTVRRLIARNLLSASKGIRHVRITKQAIQAYLANTSK